MCRVEGKGSGGVKGFRRLVKGKRVGLERKITGSRERDGRNRAILVDKPTEYM